MNHHLSVTKHRIFAVALCAIGIQISHAETVTSMKQALEKVKQYQGQSEVSQQRQQISELQIKNKSLWKNPSVSISQEGFASDQERQLSFSINQPIDILGERKLNKKIAQLAGQQNELQQQLWNAQSELIVKFTWSQLALAEVEQQIYAAQLQVSQNNLDSAKKRYQAGSIALVDYERAQIEALENQRLFQQASLDLQVAEHRLSNLWGENEADIQINKSIKPWPEQSQMTVENYIASGWLEKLYGLNTIQAKQNIEQLKIKGRANPNLNIGMTSTKNPNDKTDNALMLGVEIPLNIFNRQQYSIPMAQQHQLLLTKQQQRELKQQLLDIANALQQLKGLGTQFSSVSRQLDLAEKVQQRTLTGFQVGKLSITDVQQASLQLQSIRMGQLNVLRQAWQTALSAEALSLGTSYEQVSSSDAYSKLNKLALEQANRLINLGAE